MRVVLSAISTCAVATTIFVLVLNSISNSAFRSLDTAAAIRASNALSFSFNETIRQDWSKLEEFTSIGQIGNITHHNADGDQSVWEALAGPDGIIQASSIQSCIGRDYSGYEWFEYGMKEASAITMPANNNPNRSGEIILSLPLKDELGATVGVAARGVKLKKYENFLIRGRAELGVSVLILNKEGSTLIDTRQNAGPLPSRLRAISEIGLPATGSEIGQLDDPPTLLSFSPDFFDVFPSELGWRAYTSSVSLFDRSDLHKVTGAIWIAICAMNAFILIVWIALLRYLTRPFERLSHTAQMLASGLYDYPFESISSREAASLSSSLAIVQSEIARHQKTVQAKVPPEIGGST